MEGIKDQERILSKMKRPFFIGAQCGTLQVQVAPGNATTLRLNQLLPQKCHQSPFSPLAIQIQGGHPSSESKQITLPSEFLIELSEDQYLGLIQAQ